MADEIESAPTPEDRPRRFSAYYYSFDPTGADAIDDILSAVAWAGKCYHLTEDWTNVDDDGWSERDRIQLAANESALAVAAIRSETRAELIAELRRMADEAWGDFSGPRIMTASESAALSAAADRLEAMARETE
jgi:hypothetical protein